MATCVNHPREQTRLSCSTCGDPICPRCMRPSPVGQKCPRCARQPHAARALGRPVHYVRAVSAGLATAAAGGLGLGGLLASFGVGSILLSAALGFAAGSAVRWGAARQASTPFVTIAVVCALAGVAVAMLVRSGLTSVLPGGALGLLAYPVAGWFAVRGLHR